MSVADKDILETLADLEFQAEMEMDCEEKGSGPAQRVTTFRRLLREAGYDIPHNFHWQDHLRDDQT